MMNTGGYLEREQLLLRVSQLYYEHDLTQRQIGERLHLTRWQVGRLLSQARAAGIVRVEIVHPNARCHQLEEQLCASSGLNQAIVVPGSPDSQLSMRLVARAAADFLADLRPSPKTLAISWGRTMAALAEAIPPGWSNQVTVVQANGGVSHPSEGAPTTVIDLLAQQSRGKPVFLPVPALVTSAMLAKALAEEDQVRTVLQMARGADVLVFSCGALASDSVLVKSGCVQAGEIAEIKAKGCVGDVVGRYVDADGYPVSKDLEDRAIGLSLQDVIEAKLSIAVAAGAKKFQIAEAVVRRGLCDVLITDQQTAAYLTSQF